MVKIKTLIPNGGNRPNNPKTIVIHSMGEYLDDNGFVQHAVPFLNRVGLSAHAVGAPDGTIYRLREDNQRAYHAKGFNTDSLGYEVLVPGTYNYDSFLEAIKYPYITPTQYKALLEQTREWIDLYDIKQIVRHSDIDPIRKKDPGDGFPWEEFLADLGK